MRATRLGLVLLLDAFLVLTAYAIYRHGYVGLLEAAMTNAATIQVSVDLVIALSLVSIWLVRDARERGISPLPYLLVTLTLGSIGPLVYLIRRTYPARVAGKMAVRAA